MLMPGFSAIGMLHSSDPRQALSWVIQDLHRRGWAAGTGGNFSLVTNRDPLRLLMAPSGVDKGLVQPDDLIEVNAQGQVLAGSGKASAETLLHLAIIQQTGAASVLHTHSPIATLLSRRAEAAGAIAFSGYEMLKGLEGITTHATEVSLPVFPNDQDMAALSQAVLPTLQAAPPWGVLIAGHGLYAWGNSLFAARRHVEILEFLLELHYRELAIASH